MKPMAVITTIQAPTPAMEALATCLARHATPLVVVGDAKGPQAYPLEGAYYLNLATQREGPFRLGLTLPTGHYARKNVGYLTAIAQGATAIFETDDDNEPLEAWHPSLLGVNGRQWKAPGWLNVYRFFTQAHIWPRGFPLTELHQRPETGDLPLRFVKAPIQQSLVNGSPDVDAIWRLVMDQELIFDRQLPVYLAPGVWCPFNSQATWWHPQAFPLLYLPSGCTFRMTDIWRSYVAQRCLWAMGLGVLFHAPHMRQARNPHDLLRDFQDEVPGYLQADRITSMLASTKLLSDPASTGDNLRTCYKLLVNTSILPASEMALVETWLQDLAQAQQLASRLTP